MKPFFLNLIFAVMILSVNSCIHNNIVNTVDPEIETDYTSPFNAGAFNYSHRVDTVFPSYMEDIKEIDVRIPKTNTKDKFEVIIVEPGFFSSSTDLEDIKDRYASHGFIVVGVTNTSHYNLITTSLEPYKVALEQTIQYLLESNVDANSDLYGLIDTNAIAVTAHSMGGGGVLMLCNDIDSKYAKYVKTAIAMNPFGNCDASNIDIPIFMFSSDKDNVINPFMIGKTSKPEDVYKSYKSLPDLSAKIFANYKDMDHNGVVDYGIFLATSGNADIFLPTMLSWFKVYLADDESYKQYLSVDGAGYEKLKGNFIAHGDVPAYVY